MLDKIKKHKYQIIELVCIFIVTLLYNLICAKYSGDEIWNFGFSYNISTGLIPYKDFNMIITPLYPIMGALFLTIFGKKLLIYHIFHSIICTLIFLCLKKQSKNNSYLIYLIFLLNAYPSYNVFCILLLYILMILEEKNINPYYIGVIIGLTFLTKQNIGIYLLIPSLFTKDIKIILKRIIGFSIPNIIMLIYLSINNCVYEFIDYTIMGIDSFAKENFLMSINNLIPTIIIIIILSIQYIKKKDIKIIYLICFQLLVFPMNEKYHIMIALTPAIGYLLSHIKSNKRIIISIFIINIIIIFSANIYNIYHLDFSFPNNSQLYRYKKIPRLDIEANKKIASYIKTIEDELYIISKNAYQIKLEANIPINKYDLLNNGNLGRGGQEQIINDIKDNCLHKQCIFLVDLQGITDNSHFSYAEQIIKYIITHYNQKERQEYLIVYKNY